MLKEKRNTLIIKTWNEGKSNQEILTTLKRAGYKDLKDTHSLSGVVARLKRVGKLPKERPQSQQVDKLTSQQITKSISQQVYKRATYYLTPEIVKKIKLLAVQRDKDASELMREILGEYLSQQGDL
ncbi:MAG: CopG family transcriptional regulator [Candidatus Aerophobetes bacterium]|nr:CopG family transcriptional regulator [Candidatus Aerophobetes bacterium]